VPPFNQPRGDLLGEATDNHGPGSLFFTPLRSKDKPHTSRLCSRFKEASPKASAARKRLSISDTSDVEAVLRNQQTTPPTPFHNILRRQEQLGVVQRNELGTPTYPTPLPNLPILDSTWRLHDGLRSAHYSCDHHAGSRLELVLPKRAATSPSSTPPPRLIPPPCLPTTV
jgi:hypothetical protein